MLYIGLFPSIHLNPGFSREVRADFVASQLASGVPTSARKKALPFSAVQASQRSTVFSRKRTVETHRTTNWDKKITDWERLKNSSSLQIGPCSVGVFSQAIAEVYSELNEPPRIFAVSSWIF
jgi:hypothetical protein